MSLVMKMAQTNSNQVRLYTRFISILKIIQYIGYFIVVVLSLNFFVVTGKVIASIPGATIGFLDIIGILLPAAIGCVIVYIFTQALITLIDLLSRIEHNTRRL
jgi:hypothetical protein